MNIHKSVDELVGNTPLLGLVHLEERFGCKARLSPDGGDRYFSTPLFQEENQ